MRKQLALAEKLQHGRQKQRWFLVRRPVYCDAVELLVEELRPGR